jgi:hypothetical protein
MFFNLLMKHGKNMNDADESGKVSIGGWLNYFFLSRTSSVAKSVHPNIWG